jgi:gas vesicle protein
LREANSPISKLKDYVIGGIIGAILGAIATALLQ